MLAIDFFKQLQARELVLVVDNETLKSPLQELGFKDISLTNEFDFISNQQPVLWLISDYESQYKMADLWDEAGGIIVQMTESKAGGDDNTLLYAIDTLLNADIAEVLAQREESYEKLLSHDVLTIHNQDAELKCHIGEEVSIANADNELESGYLYSLAEFFKASLINMDSPASTFRLEGKLAFSGFLHQANKKELKQDSLPVMQKFQQLANQGGDNYLIFKDNRITALIIGGEDLSADLLNLCADKEWQTSATEFALALLDFNPDWNLNTLFHQTHQGLHIGIGMGEQIPFMDFKAAAARVDFS